MHPAGWVTMASVGDEAVVRKLLAKVPAPIFQSLIELSIDVLLLALGDEFFGCLEPLGEWHVEQHLGMFNHARVQLARGRDPPPGAILIYLHDHEVPHLTIWQPRRGFQALDEQSVAMLDFLQSSCNVKHVSRDPLTELATHVLRTRVDQLRH